MAVAREMGMRQRPLPWRYCMAEPMSSSMSFATWCSVTVMVSLDDAVWLLLLALLFVLEVLPLAVLPWDLPLELACMQSPPPPPCKDKTKQKKKKIKKQKKKKKRKKEKKKKLCWNVVLICLVSREKEKYMGAF